MGIKYNKIHTYSHAHTHTQKQQKYTSKKKNTIGKRRYKTYTHTNTDIKLDIIRSAMRQNIHNSMLTMRALLYTSIETMCL